MAFSELYPLLTQKLRPAADPDIQEASLAFLSKAEVNLLARVDKDGILREIHFSKQAHLTLAVDEWLGKNIYQFIQEDWVTDGLKKLRQAILTGHEYTFKHTFGEGAEAHTLEFKIIPTSDQDAFVILQDISERSRTESKLLQLNRTLLALQAAATAVTSSLDLRQILDSFVWETSNILHADGCAIYSGVSDQAVLSCQATYFVEAAGSPDFPETIHLHEYPVVQAVLSERSSRQIMANTQTTSLAELNLLRRLGGNLLLFIPMIFQDRIVGIVQVMSTHHENGYTDQEISLAQLLSNQAAAAIMNAGLYDKAQEEIHHRKLAEASLEQERTLLAQRVEERTAELQTQLAQQSALAAIETTISHPQRLQAILQQIVNVVASTLFSEGDAAIVLMEPRSKQFSVRATSETLSAASGPAAAWHDADTTRWIIDHQEVILVPDMNQILAENGKQLQIAGFQSYMAAPIIANNNCLGVLYAVCPTPRHFTQEDQDFLEALANRAGISIANVMLYERMKAANDELAQASKLKDEFLASMSHELRTPLNAILGITEALLDQTNDSLDERQMRSLEIVQQSGEHLLAIINDILDISRIESGAMNLELTPVHVSQVCQASLKMVSKIAEHKNISISLQVASGLSTVPADLRRLKQILLNLLSNAVKFTPEGGEIGLEVNEDVDGSFVSFTVWDTGIGIPEADQTILFEPFVQLDSRLSRQYPGTGLGLALVERMVKLHGGVVAVFSEVGRGSRFTVMIPQQLDFVKNVTDMARTSRAETKPLLEKIGSSPTTPNGLIILLAEDDDNLREIFQASLIYDGYQVIPAKNGREALARIGEQEPDLILLDLQMPEMDGMEALHQIRGMPDVQRMPIITLSGVSDPADRERCLQAGANDFVVKPISLQHLKHVIQKNLAANQAELSK